MTTDVEIPELRQIASGVASSTLDLLNKVEKSNWEDKIEGIEVGFEKIRRQPPFIKKIIDSDVKYPDDNERGTYYIKTGDGYLTVIASLKAGKDKSGVDSIEEVRFESGSDYVLFMQYNDPNNMSVSEDNPRLGVYNSETRENMSGDEADFWIRDSKKSDAQNLIQALVAFNRGLQDRKPKESHFRFSDPSTRRGFLQLAGLALSAELLSACNLQSTSEPTSENSANEVDSTIKEFRRKIESDATEVHEFQNLDELEDYLGGLDKVALDKDIKLATREEIVEARKRLFEGFGIKTWSVVIQKGMWERIQGAWMCWVQTIQSSGLDRMSRRIIQC